MKSLFQQYFFHNYTNQENANFRKRKMFPWCLVAFQKIFRKIFSGVWKRRRKTQIRKCRIAPCRRATSDDRGAIVRWVVRSTIAIASLVDRAARTIIAPRDLIDRAGRLTIAPRDLVDRTASRRSGAIWALSSFSLSLIWALSSLSLFF